MTPAKKNSRLESIFAALPTTPNQFSARHRHLEMGVSDHGAAGGGETAATKVGDSHAFDGNTRGMSVIFADKMNIFVPQRQSDGFHALVHQYNFPLGELVACIGSRLDSDATNRICSLHILKQNRMSNGTKN